MNTVAFCLWASRINSKERHVKKLQETIKMLEKKPFESDNPFLI